MKISPLLSGIDRILPEEYRMVHEVYLSKWIGRVIIDRAEEPACSDVVIIELHRTQ